MRFPALALLCLIACLDEARAARIEIPLRLSLETLREALGSQVRLAYREGRCRYLKVEPLRVEAAQGRLRVSGPGRGALGVEAAGMCQTAAAWQGSLQFTLAPRIDGAGHLRLRILDSRLTGVPPVLWDFGKPHLHRRLERFSYDFGASREALAALVRSAAPPMHAAAMEQALQSLEIGEPRVEAAQVVIPLALELPDAWLAPPPAASGAAPLTEAELEALEKALEPLDAFLVYIVRHVARGDQDAELRQRLFTLLLESRYQLVVTQYVHETAALSLRPRSTEHASRGFVDESHATAGFDSDDAIAHGGQYGGQPTPFTLQRGHSRSKRVGQPLDGPCYLVEIGRPR